VTTVAGSSDSSYGFSGDGGLATLATLYAPNGVYMDPSGKLFIADTGNNRIRVVDTNNIIRTFAGTGYTVFNGDGIPATGTNINYPRDVKGDSLGNIYFSSGNVYFADHNNNIIRMVDVSGIAFILFGSPDQSGGFSASISPRRSRINTPNSIWLDSVGTVYFTDQTSIHRGIVVSSPTSQPSLSEQPSYVPTKPPSEMPSRRPTIMPSGDPTRQPSEIITRHPTSVPSVEPNSSPTSEPNAPLSGEPSSMPKGQPSMSPTHHPTGQPSSKPTVRSTGKPSEIPTHRPIAMPSADPTTFSSGEPSGQPSGSSTQHPSAQPRRITSTNPPIRPVSVAPSSTSSQMPTLKPTVQTESIVVVNVGMTIGSVRDDSLSVASQETIKQSIANASQTTVNNVDLVSVTRTNRRLLSSVVHRMLATVSLFSYKVVAEIHFNLIDFPGLNESSVAGTKSKLIVHSVESGHFNGILHYYVIISNSTQLWNSTGTGITVTTKVTPPPAKSSHSSDTVKNGQWVGLIAGVSVGTVFLVGLIVYCAFSRKTRILPSHAYNSDNK
jgi:hypothetical protein